MADSTPDGDAWLVVIDPQVIFASPESDWGSPMFAAIVPRVHALARGFTGRVVVTRFVAPTSPRGSWADYYARWPFARATASVTPQQVAPPRSAGWST